MTETINSLYFDDVDFDKAIRRLVKSRLAEDDIDEMFGKEVKLLTLDAQNDITKAKLPAIYLQVVNPTPYEMTQEDIQIQAHTRFTVEINVYTSGKNQKVNNMKLCNILIRLMQSNGYIGTHDDYYVRGLKLQENTEVSSLVADTTRRVMRFSGVCDNRTNLIYSI